MTSQRLKQRMEARKRQDSSARQSKDVKNKAIQEKKEQTPSQIILGNEEEKKERAQTLQI